MTNKPRKWWLNCKEYETVIIKPYKEYDLKTAFSVSVCYSMSSDSIHLSKPLLFWCHSVWFTFFPCLSVAIYNLCNCFVFNLELFTSECMSWLNDGYASANSQPKTCPESLPNNFPLWRFLNLVFLSFSHYWLHVSFCQQKRRFFLHCSLLNVCLSLSSDLFLSQYRPPLTYSWASLITFSVCPWDVVHISIVVSHNWIVCL